MKTKVAIHRCPTYPESRKALLSVLEASGLGERLVGKRVLLKPNMMKGSAPEKCNNTHPEFLGALTRILVEKGCEVLVGESSGLLGFTDEVMEVSGVAEAVINAGGKIINFDAGPFKKVSVEGKFMGTFWLPRVLFDVDVVVQVPKLKTHSLTMITAAMKNLVGTLPGATKCDLHVRLPNTVDFSHGLLDLYLAMKTGGVNLGGAIVDGVWGLAGRGPGIGPIPKRTGLVVAGEDLSAVDVVCAEATGFNPYEVPTIRAAIERGLGPAGMEDVLLVGDSLNPYPEPFEHPVRDLAERWDFSTRFYYRQRGRILKLKHNPDLCEGQRLCVDVCPVGCIQVRGDRLVIGDSCILCYACHEVCPTGAMRLLCPWWLKDMFRKRAEGIDTRKLA